MVVLVLMPQFEMTDIFSIVNQYGWFAEIISERGMIKHPVENRFTVYLFFQELYITAVYDIVVDASNDLLLIDQIRGSVPLPVDRIEQIVLRNVYFEKLLDVLPGRGRIIERH